MPIRTHRHKDIFKNTYYITADGKYKIWKTTGKDAKWFVSTLPEDIIYPNVSEGFLTKWSAMIFVEEHQKSI